MATAGDIFVNVRAKTSALTKGLKAARRKLSAFAKSASGMFVGIAAVFGIFKLGQKLLGAMVYHSDEFRAAWAALNNAATKMMMTLAEKIGPALASGANQLADWLANSATLRDYFAMIGEVITETLIPAAKTFFGFMDRASDGIADMISELTGVNQTQRNLEQGLQADGTSVVDAAYDQAQDRTRRGALMAKYNAANVAGNSAAAEMYLRQIRDRVEVPR